jgi:hypothetical protein
MKLVEYHDQERDILYTIPEFENQSQDSLLINCSPQVHAAITNALSNLAHMKDVDEVPVFLIDSVVISLDRESAQEKLQTSLDYYLKDEDYKMCKVLTDLGTKLNS